MKWMKFFRWIGLWFTIFKKKDKPLYEEQKREIATTNDSDLLKSNELEAEVKEHTWFSRANNLAEEFAAGPTPIHSSNFEVTDPVGYLWPDGRVTRDELGAFTISRIKKESFDDLPEDEQFNPKDEYKGEREDEVNNTAKFDDYAL